ncbi:MAG: hypothetical protein SGI77_15505 [Pirellulaceae bacterium]|nr:hypothetical protein [Pirellulaceae bacterium]
MIKQLPSLTWRAAFVLMTIAAAIPTAVVFGQGDEGSSKSNGSTEGLVWGNAIQRILRPREGNSESSSSQTGTSRGFKPGMFQGGIVKQLRGTTEGNEESSVRVEKSNRTSDQQFSAPIPTSPSQMAQKTSREPFSFNSGIPKPPPSPRSPAGRDIFSDDPPSIVGTGVASRSQSSSNLNSPKAVAQNQLPPITKAQSKSTPTLIPPTYNAYKTPASKSVAEEELPRVSRKSVPTATQTQTLTQTLTQTPDQVPDQSKNQAKSRSVEPGFMMPNNVYAAPSAASTTQSTTTQSTTTQSSTTNARTPSLSIEPAKNASLPTITAGSSAEGTGMRLEMGVPKVKLLVSGPPALQVGQAVPYEVLVRNDGTEMLGGIIVSMTIPASVKSSLPVATAGEYESEKDAAGVESLLWHVTDIAPSQSRVFRISLEATKAEHIAMAVEWTVLPQTGTINVDVQQPQLNIAIEGPSEVVWGKPEVYRLRVRNPGNAEVKDVDVRLTAEAYGSNQTKLGNLAAGSERIVEVELTFQQSGTIKIEGEAQSIVNSLDSKSSIDVAVTQVELLADWNTPVAQYQGSVADYRLNLRNASSVIAENTSCVAFIPPGLKPVSLPDGAVVKGNEVRWTVPRIDANASSNFEFAFQAVEAGAATIKANIQCNGGGKALVETVVQVESVSDLKLSVTDPVAPAPVGQDVVYDLVIVNRGSKTAQSVKILAQFSHGIEPVRTEGGSSKILPGQVVFDPIAAIQPGESITLRVVAQAAEAGMHRFRAELECADGETQLIEEETTRYLATTRTDSSKSSIRR